MILSNVFGLAEHRATLAITGAGVGRDATLNEVFGPRGKTASGVEVTEDSAMTLSAVYAAVRLLSWSRAMLPLFVYRRKKNGDKEQLAAHPVSRLLHSRPNPEMTAMAFRATLAQYELLWGNSYAWIETAKSGEVGALWPLDASKVRVGRRADRSLIYDLQRLDDSPTTKPWLAANEVLHVPNCVGLKGRFNGVVGRSVISYAREQLGEALAAQEFGAGFFAGGSVYAFAIKHPRTLGPNTAEKLRKNFEAVHGTGRRRIPVLEEGMELDQFGMPLKDAQFLESRQFHIPEIARWFGLPPHKLRDLTRATYSNISEENLAFYQDLLPWLMLTEQESNFKLFTPSERGELFIEHIVEAMLKGDIDKRNKAHQTAVLTGWMNRNEARRKENLNTMGPEGDVYMVPANMMAADRLMESPQSDQDLTATEEKSRLAARKAGLVRAVERMLHKEALEIRRAARKPDQFLGWLDRFYDRTWPQKFHRGILPSAEAIPLDAEEFAHKYARRSKAVILELSGRVTPDELLAALDEELESWPQAAGEIVEDAFAEAEKVTG